MHAPFYQELKILKKLNKGVITVIIYVEKPPYKICIGNQGENDFRTINFNWDAWKALYPNGTISIYFMRPDMSYCYPVVSYAISNPVVWRPDLTATSVYGDGQLVIRLMSGDIVAKSTIIYTKTNNSPDFTDVAPEAWADWLATVEQYSISATASASQANEFKNLAGISELASSEAALLATQKALDAAESQVAANSSEENAYISETSALESMQTAVQAMQDLLAMMGTDIATLTDGKLTPSQIPALSINDVFNVANITEMIALTAQRGDVALLVVENIVTDSYILASEDSTLLTNWKKLGVSYVANAGHANTSDIAVNSTKINNHNMVEMTQSEFDIAVKDPNTYYLVY